MVQVIDDPYSGNVFGRLGKGIGQGLSQQIPKEVERYRLSSGLKKFEKESAGLTPLQQFTRLASIPGITAEHLYTIVPLLRQQAQRAEGSNIGGSPSQGETSVKEDSLPPKGSQGAKALGGDKTIEDVKKFVEPTGLAMTQLPLKSLEQTQAQLTPIVKKTPKQLFSEAAQLSQQNPFTYPTPQDALPFVEQAENTRISNLEEQRRTGDVADQLQDRIKARLQTIWGKENTAKGIEDTIQTKLARNIEADLANPNNRLSEQQLIDKYAAIGKRLAQANTNLMARAKMGVFSTDFSPKKNRETIEEVRKRYKEADGLEEFQNILANQFNFSSGVAAELAYPPENKDVNKIVRDLSSPIRNEKGVTYPGEVERLTREAADQIAPLLNEDDSILSYAREIQKHGLNGELFLQRLKEHIEDGTFFPTTRQENEFQVRLPRFPSLGDILYR